MASTIAPTDVMANATIPARRSFASGLYLSLARVRRQVETWEERKRFRLKLEDMLVTAPHLIDDIGLTKERAEAEISKPFWRD